MRIAACLSGEMRGYPECLVSLDTMIFQPLRAAGGTIDLLVVTRLDPWWKMAVDLPFRMLHVEKNVPWLDPADIISEHNPLRHGQANNETPGTAMDGRRTFLYQSYLQYYKSLQEMGALKRKAEAQDGKPYDWVIRCRPDVYYENPLNVPLLLEQPTWIRTPQNDTYGWVSDKFAIGSSGNMDVYFNRRDYVKGYCQQWELHAERLLHWQLSQAGIYHDTLAGLIVVRPEKMYAHSRRPDREDI